VSLDVNDICTDAHLEEYTLGRSNLTEIIPAEWLDGDDAKTALIARQNALAFVLECLARRRPPIRESDLLVPSELKIAVAYRTLSMLYGGAITFDESPFGKQSKRFDALFTQEMTSLQPTVRSGTTTSSLSVRFSRG
jgi:hypothetical protein